MRRGEQGREGFILARTEIDFRSEAHEGDELEVRLTLDGFGRTSAAYSYEVVDVPYRTRRREREIRAGLVRLSG